MQKNIPLIINKPWFKQVSISDISWIKPLVYASGTRNADFSFSNIYSWYDTYSTEVAKINSCLVVRTVYSEDTGYCFPIGSRNPEELISIIHTVRDYAMERDGFFKLLSLSDDDLLFLERNFTGQFDVTPVEDRFDYVYDAAKLISLAGKKLHSKRNYINRFINEFGSWSFEAVNSDNIDECFLMERQWASGKEGSFETIHGEASALSVSLDNFEDLRLDGGILRINGGICAFTIGERLSEDTYVIHFEKALHEIPGAYQMINREFVSHICEKYPEIAFINREEDMGLENLRKSKRSYYPELMVKKYMAVFK